MAFDPVAFKKTKHILRAAEFLRDFVTREVVSVEHISGVVMLADILTKAASRGGWRLFCRSDQAARLFCMMPVGFILSLAPALGPGGAVPGHFLILSLPAPSTLTLFIARTGLLVCS